MFMWALSCSLRETIDRYRELLTHDDNTTTGLRCGHARSLVPDNETHHLRLDFLVMILAKRSGGIAEQCRTSTAGLLEPSSYVSL